MSGWIFCSLTEGLIAMAQRIVLLFCLLCGLCGAARAQTVIHPTKEPESLEERVAMADVVALGVVERVEAVDKRGGLDRQPTREPSLATVRVEKIYKGTADAKSLTVLFTHALRDTKPPLVELKQGERAVLFLKAPRGGEALEFISPFYGKNKPDAGLLKQLEAMSDKQSLAAEVSLTLETQAPDANGGARVKVLLSNNGAVPVVFGATPAPGQNLLVSGPDGKPLPPRARDADAARFSLYLPAHGSFSYTVDLAQYFDLSKPGNYQVEAAFDPPASRGAWSGALRAQGAVLAIP